MRAHDGFDADTWARMAEAGWLSARVPEAQGGLGLGTADAAAIMVEAGRAGAADPLITGCFVPSAILSQLSTSAASQALAAFAEGGPPFALALQDKPLDLRDEMLSFDILGAGENVLFLAQVNGALSIRMMKRPKGCPAPLADGTPLDSCAVDAGALRQARSLGDGPSCSEQWAAGMREGAMLVSAQMTGCAAALLDLTTEHCRQRVQFGQPIAGFQVVRHRIVDMQIALQLALTSCADALAASEDGAGASLATHAAKARCSAAAMEIARAAIQLHGAIGFTEESRTATLIRQAMSFSSMFGSAAFHRAQAARLMDKAGQVA